MPITMQEFMNDTERLQRFKDATPAGREETLGILNPSFRTISPQGKEIVINKILSLPAMNSITGELDAPLEWKDVPIKALKNIPKSSIELGKNIWQAIRHPEQTRQALIDVTAGGIEKLIPGEQQEEKIFNATIDLFKERYGGLDRLKQTIANDPVGFLTDVSAVLGGTGALVSTTGKLSKIGTVSRVGQSLSKAVTLADPIGLGGKGITKLSKPLIPPSLAKSALKLQTKPRLTEIQKLQKIDRLADEAVQHGLKVNRKSIIKLGDGIKEVQNKIDDIIKTGERQGIRIKVGDVTKALDDLIGEIEGLPIETLSTKTQLKTIKKFKNDILKSKQTLSGALTGKKATLTPSEVQRLKVLKNQKYTPNVKTTTDAINKVVDDKIRKATKTLLEEKFPQLKKLNLQQGDMIELQSAIARRLRVTESGKTFGVPGLVVGGVAGTAAGLTTGTTPLASTIIGGATFAAVAFAFEKVISSPNIQLWLARNINKANKIVAKAGNIHLVTQPSFQTGRIATTAQEAIQE